MAKKDKNEIRRAVHTRIRKKIAGTGERPRLAVFRSVNHIYVQLIDDTKGQTLVSASTTESAFGGKSGGNIEAAKEVGKLVAERAKEKGVSRVVFDRGGFIYHGRIKSLAEAAREAGLEF
jgi:large subunit ribosomal protein L18